MTAIEDEIERRALAAIEILARMAPVRAAYLFGSHVEGQPGQWSDIDVAVFMEGIEDGDLERHVKAMSKVQLEIGYDVEAHLFPASSFDNPEPASFAQYILRHGVPLAIGPESS